jgi:hypothetical protein
MIDARDHRLLQVWEEQQHAHPVRRALGLLAATHAGRGEAGWAQVPIGARDRALMELCETLFGGALHTTTACPRCGERLESDFSVAQLRSAAPARDGDARALRLEQHGYAIEYRLPTSDDLLELLEDEVSSAPGVDAAARLLQRCVTAARHGDEVLGAAALPPELVGRLGAEMASHDPDADVRIALVCPACSLAWQMHFDVVSYLWSELDDWAQRVLVDVHLLARAYGWSERAILALSPQRRRIYLEMASAA